MGKPRVDIEVDDDTGVWRVDGMPMILVPRHFFVNNHNAVESALGADAYGTQLREAGYRSAYDWCEAEAATHNLSGADVLRHYMKRLSQRGWGRFRIESLQPEQGRARVRVDHSVFVAQSAADTNAKLCYMFSGWLVGSMEYVGRSLGRQKAIDAREQWCAADGEHGYCLFSVYPVKAEKR